MGNKLYGAILGDLAGQPYEYKYQGDFSEFNIHDERSTITDDTILTLAVAKTILDGKTSINDFAQVYKEFGNKYTGDLYGKGFKDWLSSPEGTINDSYGNGSLMRISPILYAYKYHKDVAYQIMVNSVISTHFHPQTFEALQGYYFIRNNFSIFANRREAGNYDGFEIQPFKKFTSNVMDTITFVSKLARKSTSTHQAIELAVKAGGDTDTHASIIAEITNEVFQDLTEKDIEYVESKLSPELLDILHRFNEQFKD